MFRKKPTEPVKRHVRPQAKASVFSYYANRSPDGEPDNGRQQPSPGSNWLVNIPTFLAGIALIFCLFYISTLSTQPKIQILGSQTSKTLVNGTKFYEDEIQKILEDSIINRSKLLINTNQVADSIKQNYPELGEVSVVLPLVGRRPIVEVSPAQPALVLSTLEGTFIIDSSGRAIAEARAVESSIRDGLPSVQDESGLPIKRGDVALPEQTIKFINEVHGQLEASKIKVQAITLPTVSNELHIRLEGKHYFVKFDVRGEGRTQAGTFIAVKEKLDADKITPKEYLDVRVPEKAFYK